MARWSNESAAPPELADAFRPGWRDHCLAWLREHDGRGLPFGEAGDITDLMVACREIRLSRRA